MSDREAMLVIAHQQLSPEALAGLIEEFVTRDGTDSGYTRGSLEENVAMVRRQLDAGQALIVYDQVTNTCNVVPAETARGHRQRPLRSKPDKEKKP
ncbi:YheU family protein [Desulfosarcina sp.]|uniref:YheU family protein n=1 Tax=Desulfosarcina sp. TaxID=2027861 RepID=UPI003970C5C2